MSKTFHWGWLVLSAGLYAQDVTAPASTPAQTSASTSAETPAYTSPNKPPRFYCGFRIEDFPLNQFKTGTTDITTAQPVAAYTYISVSNSQKAALAASFEFMARPRWSAGVEFYLTHAKFVQTTELKTGIPDPNSGTDDRPITTTVQTSTANYWVLPFLVRYYELRPRGIFSRTYAIGGLEYRHIGRVRTGNDIYYPDGSTGYNEIPVVPVHSNQVGVVAGVGYRFRDAFGIKVTPELRYIRWNNSAFQGVGYASAVNQGEVSLGFSF